AIGIEQQLREPRNLAQPHQRNRGGNGVDATRQAGGARIDLPQDRPEQGGMPPQLVRDLVDVGIPVEHRDEADHFMRRRTAAAGVKELWLREEEALEEVESRRLGLAELLV